MHTGSRAFCFLMALAATGAEYASAAVTATSPAETGHYCVEAQSATATESNLVPAFVLANHLLAVVAVSHIIAATDERRFFLAQGRRFLRHAQLCDSPSFRRDLRL